MSFPESSPVTHWFQPCHILDPVLPYPRPNPATSWIQSCHTLYPAMSHTGSSSSHTGSGPAILWITTRNSNNVELTLPDPLRGNLSRGQRSLMNVSPRQVNSFEPGSDVKSKSRIKNAGTFITKNTHFGHPYRPKCLLKGQLEQHYGKMAISWRKRCVVGCQFACL